MVWFLHYNARKTIIMQDVIKIALIIKKCKELLNGADVIITPLGWEIEATQDDGQTVYFIRDLGPAPTDGRRGYTARLIIPPDGKFFAEWNRFKDEGEILDAISRV